jgi:hypothetical protein
VLAFIVPLAAHPRLPGLRDRAPLMTRPSRTRRTKPSLPIRTEDDQRRVLAADYLPRCPLATSTHAALDDTSRRDGWRPRKQVRQCAGREVEDMLTRV